MICAMMAIIINTGNETGHEESCWHYEGLLLLFTGKEKRWRTFKRNKSPKGCSAIAFSSCFQGAEAFLMSKLHLERLKCIAT